MLILIGDLHPLYGRMSYFPPANECGLRYKKLASSNSIGVLMYSQSLIHPGSNATIFTEKSDHRFLFTTSYSLMLYFTIFTHVERETDKTNRRSKLSCMFDKIELKLLRNHLQQRSSVIILLNDCEFYENPVQWKQSNLFSSGNL